MKASFVYELDEDILELHEEFKQLAWRISEILSYSQPEIEYYPHVTPGNFIKTAYGCSKQIKLKFSSADFLIKFPNSQNKFQESKMTLFLTLGSEYADNVHSGIMDTSLSIGAYLALGKVRFLNITEEA